MVALSKYGFTDIIPMPEKGLYDFQAMKDGRPVYIEVRMKRGRWPYFSFTDVKLERLSRLEYYTGREVYVLLVFNDKSQLLTLKELKDYRGPFKVYIKKKRGGPPTETLKQKPVPIKGTIRIRYRNPEVYRLWRSLLVDYIRTKKRAEDLLYDALKRIETRLPGRLF